MSKLTTDFVLIDESVVMHGFRALMDGAQLEAFKKNPVMLFMHGRAEPGLFPLKDDTVLPIGRWYDIRIEDKKLLAKPDFDDDDDFAKRIEKKVSNQYLNAASICLEPLAVSNEDSLKLAGQTGPTITKWGVMEASIVDIPNCRNALAIRNSKGKTLSLFAGHRDEALNYLNTLLPGKKVDLDNIAVVLGLHKDASPFQIEQKLTSLLSEASKLNVLNIERNNLASETSSLRNRINQLQVMDSKKDAIALVDGALLQRKLCAGEREMYLRLAIADFSTTKELIDRMPAYQSIEALLAFKGHYNSVELSELLKLSGQQLYLQGKLERLKQLSLHDFKLKHKEYYGIEYK